MGTYTTRHWNLDQKNSVEVDNKMGPESVANFDYLKQATSCIQQFLNELRSSPRHHQICGEEIKPEIEQQQQETASTTENEVIDELSKITMTLEKFMESQKCVNEVLTGTMKCGACGACAVGLSANGSASSGAESESGRASEERRKVSEEEDDVMSIVSRIASVDSVEQSIFEQSIKSVSSSASAQPEEEEQPTLREEEIVMKSILDSTITEQPTDTSVIDSFLQHSLFKTLELQQAQQQQHILQQQIQNQMKKEEQPIEDTTVITSILEKIFGTQIPPIINQKPPAAPQVAQKKAVENSSPNETTFDSFGALEALFNDSMNGFEPSTSEVKQTKKRKSTPLKASKVEGAGYVCPMEGCNKIFKEKGSVHRHFVTHIGMRFNCDQCKASYTQKHALMLHQKIHANPDAYQCRGCGTNYTTQNGLRLHRQRNPACMELANELLNQSAAQSTPNTPISKSSPTAAATSSAPASEIQPDLSALFLPGLLPNVDSSTDLSALLLSTLANENSTSPQKSTSNESVQITANPQFSLLGT
ncbi:unnamed protein product [Caenorhabditis angaria]|uniref:C2H2-type domain-containing protein n=1 Tax=Caenorhabditis angaria TaxID=860376 RepID=A0A9P1I3S8_9PELO|nr:unnamed protein product [Caenorhabditis angaria]